MIKEVDASQLVSYLAKRTDKDVFSCTFIKVRNIGNYIEQHDKTIHVELSERRYQAFRSRSVRHIVLSESSIKVDGAKSPIMQSLFRQYKPCDQVVSLIEEAIKTMR